MEGNSVAFQCSYKEQIQDTQYGTTKKKAYIITWNGKTFNCTDCTELNTDQRYALRRIIRISTSKQKIAEATKSQDLRKNFMIYTVKHKAKNMLAQSIT